MSASPSRYCQCGKPLARDHASARCGLCEQGDQKRAEAPELPADFWKTPGFRDAFDAQHMGHVARAYRRHPLNVANYGRDGIPQELLGDWLGLTQAQVSRIENGPPIRKAIAICPVLGSVVLLSLSRKRFDATEDRSHE